MTAETAGERLASGVGSCDAIGEAAGDGAAEIEATPPDGAPVQPASVRATRTQRFRCWCAISLTTGGARTPFKNAGPGSGAGSVVRDRLAEVRVYGRRERALQDLAVELAERPDDGVLGALADDEEQGRLARL